VREARVVRSIFLAIGRRTRRTLVEPRCPASLWVVRHGQCAPSGAARDAPLTALGEEQSAALGRWFAAMPAGRRPTLALTSPYLRARQTARRVAEAGGLADAEHEIVVDERLRERDLGILDGLSRPAILERHPEQESLRQRLGDFYYRPPGGESWCDVVLRLRSVVESLAVQHPGGRILLVTHESGVLSLRYILERFTEEEILAEARSHDVANCAVTSYVLAGDRLELERFNVVSPLMHAGAPVTRRPDSSVE
jgi:2,3-bisphosphoglycerate-dependent phosphoglycerate mutase